MSSHNGSYFKRLWRHFSGISDRSFISWVVQRALHEKCNKPMSSRFSRPISQSRRCRTNYTVSSKTRPSPPWRNVVTRYTTQGQLFGLTIPLWCEDHDRHCETVMRSWHYSGSPIEASQTGLCCFCHFLASILRTPFQRCTNVAITASAYSHAPRRIQGAQTQE